MKNVYCTSESSKIKLGGRVKVSVSVLHLVVSVMKKTRRNLRLISTMG